tara:strand:+ start:2118 stop:2558 length:441 start_codon:yes stop_codon:yes gene_type:complete
MFDWVDDLIGWLKSAYEGFTTWIGEAYQGILDFGSSVLDFLQDLVIGYFVAIKDLLLFLVDGLIYLVFNVLTIPLTWILSTLAEFAGIDVWLAEASSQGSLQTLFDVIGFANNFINFYFIAIWAMNILGAWVTFMAGKFLLTLIRG